MNENTFTCPTCLVVVDNGPVGAVCGDDGLIEDFKCQGKLIHSKDFTNAARDRLLLKLSRAMQEVLGAI